jgi:ketosteroid isomerase-like protein
VSQDSTTPDVEELVRRSIEAFGRGDVDGALTIYAPNAVWDASQFGVGVYEGGERIRDLLEDWVGPYEYFEQALEEFRDLGHGVTLSVAHQRARLPGASGHLELRWAAVVMWADGLVQQVTAYTDVDQAHAGAERLAQELE